MTKIAVLMAAYNAEKTLVEAVESVLLNQAPLHLFIVDDGSVRHVIDLLPARDNLTILRLDKNVGLPTALNHGLDVILKQNFPYIARADADDISLPTRFEKQMAFLENHPEIDLVGCWIRLFDEDTRETIMSLSPPPTSQEIKNRMYSNSALYHPTWFMRAAVFRDVGFYNTSYETAQDYDFLRRLIKKHQVANIPEYLLDYCISQKGISFQKRRRQLTVRLEVQWRMFEIANWRCYVGMGKTICLIAVPFSLVNRVKKLVYGRKISQGGTPS
ncbi:MAG: glycosyltransferase [Bdellovibrionales bacterium]